MRYYYLDKVIFNLNRSKINMTKASDIKILKTVLAVKINQIKKEFETYDASQYRLGFLDGMETSLEAVKEAIKQIEGK